MRYPWLLLYMGLMLAISSPAQAFDPRAYIEKAVQLIESGEPAFARTYLDPVLIDPRLDPGQRSRAYYLRGYSFYSQGLYVSASKDYNRALEFLPDNPVVLTSVGHLYFDGLGVERDPELAVELFRKAAEAGHEPAKLGLGVALITGTGTERDLTEGRRWLQEAADAGDAAAMLRLAQSYRKPLTTEPEPEVALSWLQRAQAAGAKDALAFVGFMYEAGELPADDPVRAARDAFEQAAAAGSAVAQAKLAHIYLSESDSPANAARALELFRAAADQNHPAGYLGLAYMYDSGIGVAADHAEAARLYRLAAQRGAVDAQIRLAHQLIRNGYLDSLREAMRWLELAADQNNPGALNDFAWLLATTTHDTLRDGARAVELARRAVAQQRTPAYLDTLAAAYAEAGDFELALSTQQEALDLTPADDADTRAELTRHLEAFQAGETWRESADSGSIPAGENPA
ncbi:MAG: hypothetical protein R3E86_16785 [Pseudomonadales bacterium]